MSISPQLESMLKNLYLHRPAPSPNRVWIDAICINQKNDSEKEKEIPLMRNIYGKAQCVVIWLGEHADDSRIALEAIPHITSSLIKLDVSLTGDATSRIEGHGLPSRGSPTWRAISRLCIWSWFRRILILQEAALARGLVFMCEDVWIHWDELESFLSVLEERRLVALIIFKSPTDDVVHSDQQTIGVTQEAISTVSNFRKSLDEQKGYKLVDALKYGRYRDCTLEVDRIYGMLSLMSSDVRKEFETSNLIDYRKPYWRMYIDVARKFIRLDSELDLLCLASSKAKHPSITSWCSDWSSEQDVTSFGAYTSNVAGGHLNHKSDPTPTVNEIKGTDKIRVRGFRVDEVSHVI